MGVLRRLIDAADFQRRFNLDVGLPIAEWVFGKRVPRPIVRGVRRAGDGLFAQLRRATSGKRRRKRRKRIR